MLIFLRCIRLVLEGYAIKKCADTALDVQLELGNMARSLCELSSVLDVACRTHLMHRHALLPSPDPVSLGAVTVTSDPISPEILLCLGDQGLRVST